MLRPDQHPANPQWAAAKVAGLPPRWRRRLIARWEKTRTAFDPASLTAQGDATRQAAYDLAGTLDSLRQAALPLEASDDDVIARALECAEACAALEADTYGDALLKPKASIHGEFAPGRRAGQAFSIAGLRESMAALCRANHIVPPKGKRMTDGGAIARMKDALWWRRALRRAMARAVEGSAISIGYVNRTRDLYVSAESMTRRKQQRRRNAAMLESTRARNEDGQEMTLAELAGSSTANPVIKRCELMTRLGGFERIAKDMQHEGLFFTVTSPSRMHKWKTVGTRVVENRKYDGTLPRDANDHLQAVMARARAALLRRDVRLYGFRIAEPNHDGTPHWHCLTFFDSAWPGATARAAYPRIAAIIRRYALGQGEVKPPLKKDLARGPWRTRKFGIEAVPRKLHLWAVAERARQNAERGAKKHRVDFERIDWAKGSAAAYLAKYISKNIDGYKVEKDLYGNDAFTSSQRVEAWASTWSIRQFQQLGGPPVGPWRELRRIKELPADAPDFLVAAHSACNKTVLVEGSNPTVSYAAYCRAQGGMFTGRDYRIKVELAESETMGRYGDMVPGRPVGVVVVGQVPYVDGIVSGVRSVRWLVESVRHTWSIIVRKAEKSVCRAAAWTRVNNCTRSTSIEKRGEFNKTIRFTDALDQFYRYRPGFVGPVNLPAVVGAYYEFCGPLDGPRMEKELKNA